MTPEELRTLLKEMGVNADEKVWRQSKPIDPKSLPAIKKQIELLNSFKTLVEQQIEKDISTVDDLRLKIKKLKRGGGDS